jgi:hypothetical protein
VSPTEDVYNVLDVTRIPSVIPVFSNLESAEAVLLGA